MTGNLAMRCPECNGILIIDARQSGGSRLVFVCTKCSRTEILIDRGKRNSRNSSWGRFYDLVNSTPSPPSASIQWKGTDVCLDFYCDCGAQSHFDGYFCYAIQCAQCGKIYGLRPEIKLVEIHKDVAVGVSNCIQVLKGEKQ